MRLPEPFQLGNLTRLAGHMPAALSPCHPNGVFLPRSRQLLGTALLLEGEPRERQDWGSLALEGIETIVNLEDRSTCLASLAGQMTAQTKSAKKEA